MPSTIQAAATTQPVPESHSTKQASKAYCGIRCVYAAALAEGVAFPGVDLVRPAYVGSREGSSVDELELAARDHGLHTFAFVDGTIGALKSVTHPVILRVESNPGSGLYDHYVLYLGDRAGQLLVLDTAADPGAPAQLRSPHDIELMWDGTGLIVSRQPIEPRTFAASAGELIGWGIGTIVVIALVKKFVPRARLSARTSLLMRTGAGGVAVEMLAVVTLALMAPAVSAICADSGMLAHKQQLKMVEQTHVAAFLKRMSLDEVNKSIASGAVVFVDARYAADYSKGHLPGAINIPVAASADLVRAYMAGVSRDTPIVVYCQSRACPFSKVVASSLLQQGYTSVQLMDGGWEEWSTWKH